MRTFLALAVLTITVLPTRAVAQRSTEVGDRIRVHRLDGDVQVGSVEAISEEEIVLNSASTGSRGIPVDQIERIDLSRGNGRRFARNMFLTVGAMAGGGGVLSAVTWKECRDTGFLSCLLVPESRSEAFAWGFLAGGLLGIPVGALVGLAVQTEQWEPLPSPSVGSVALSVTARPGRGVGLQASLPLGGYSR